MDFPDDQSTSESSVWTFFLGPGRVKQTIHSDLARHVSPELDKFVKEKSVVKDSKLGSGSVVTLEEFDAETFAAFWAYTYRGDYKVPKPPVPREEKTRRESILSPTGTWRGIYRSESMSSGVPPPAPSPPGSVSSASRSVRRQVEPQPQLQSQPQPQLQPEPISEPVSEPVPEPQPEPQPEAKSITEEEPLAEDASATPEDGSYVAVEPVEAETQPQVEPEVEPEIEPEAAPAAEIDLWDSPKDAKSKKAKKGKKGKKKNQSEFTEEAPVNFTPPSTPPPELPADVNEAPLDVPEQPTEANPVDCYGESTAAAEPEPAYDAPSPAPAAPEPEPEQEPIVETEQPAEEWEQAEQYAPEESTPQDQWEGAVEDQPQAPSKPSIDMSFAKQSQADSSPRTPGLSLWDEFAALQYNDEQRIATQTPTISGTEVPYLTFHAKVYVFATRFLIPSLAQLCLRKLHRDLLSLALEDADAMTPIPDSQALGDLATLQAPMVLDLLRYAYNHTDRLEPISETVATQIRENELRRLVVHYAACKLKALARYHSPGDSEAATPAVCQMDAKVERGENAPPRNLRVLLDTTPELASDVVYRMMSI
ncbi:hypothetical protein N7507_006763 [Penicillium longicatenatum]|nr:hypothetical protein N7507_006763 [Penicillium longicatenatum]